MSWGVVGVFQLSCVIQPWSWEQAIVCLVSCQPSNSRTSWAFPIYHAKEEIRCEKFELKGGVGEKHYSGNQPIEIFAF